jgi:hypothetical protein
MRSFLRCPIYRVSCELSEAGILPLDQLKERVCASIDADPERWWDDEAIAGEDGPPRDAQEMLDELQIEVRKARSVQEIISVLFEEHFDPETGQQAGRG